MSLGSIGQVEYHRPIFGKIQSNQTAAENLPTIRRTNNHTNPSKPEGLSDSVRVNISQEGRAAADATTAEAKPTDTTYFDINRNHHPLVKRIAAGLGKELANASCQSVAEVLPEPFSTIGSVTCKAMAGYMGAKLIPELANFYMAQMHPPMEP